MRVNTTSETSNQEIMKPKTASTIPVHCSYLRLADVTSIVPHPKNPNKHGDTQVALLAKIIKHQGWRSPITISKRSGFVVAGHGRLQAAALLQVEQVPVDEQEFSSEADELAHLVADNRIAELAEVDTSVISELLKELGDIDFDMDLTGFDSKSLDALINESSKDDSSQHKSPDDFPVVNEDIATEHQCPKCKYQWSGGKKVQEQEEAE